MDPNDNFNALSRYPLNHTPYRSQSSMLRSPFQSSSFQTPQHGNLRPQKTCSCKCTCTPASRQTGCPSLLLGQNYLPTGARKRAIDEYSDKENQSPGPSSPPPKKQKRTYTKRRTIDEKLSDIFTVIDKAGWSFADFLFYAFRHKDDNGEDIQAHANTIQKFFGGYTDRTPADILNFWFHSPDGRLDEDSVLTYSVTTPYTDIKPVRGCLTSFAVQIVERRLIREATNATRPSSGLHAVLSRNSCLKRAEWVDVGATTVPEVAGILKKHQPLTWHYFTKIAARKPRVRRQVVSVRKHRPTDVVSPCHSESDESA